MNESLQQARALFNTAHRVEEDSHKLNACTENSNEPILQAYHAWNMAVATKYMLNPFKRMAPFKKGTQLLEELISENFDDVEMRYIRYTLQGQAPRFLGYYRSLETDRKVLADYLRKNPGSELSKHILVYVLDTNDVLKQEAGVANS